jgi:hypothetical protein
LPQLPFKNKVHEVEALVENDVLPLRATIVLDFLKDEQRKEAKRHPGAFVAALMPPSAEAHTYGWRSTEVGRDERIVGYVKTKPEHAEALEAKSGRRVVFFPRIQADTRTKERAAVEWIIREKGESPLSYYGRALTRSTETGCPLATRLGDGSSLGLRGRGESDSRCRYIAQGLPTSWTHSSVTTWLEARGWKHLGALAPLRFKNQGWLFTAEGPAGVDDLVVYKAGVATVSVRRWRRRPPSGAPSEKLKTVASWFRTPAAQTNTTDEHEKPAQEPEAKRKNPKAGSIPKSDYIQK